MHFSSSRLIIISLAVRRAGKIELTAIARGKERTELEVNESQPLEEQGARRDAATTTRKITPVN